MKRLDDSLSAYAKVRVSVAIDARVMARVRAAAAQRHAAGRLGGQQAWLLLSVALGTALVETATWVGMVRHVRPPRLAPFSHALLQLLFVTLQLLRVVAQFLGAVLSAAAVALTSPLGMAVGLGVLLSFASFMAVHRARRPAAARGL